MRIPLSIYYSHSIVQGADLTPGSNGGFKKPQTIVSLMPGMTNIPSLSRGCEEPAGAVRLVQLRIFCSECEPKAILGQKKPYPPFPPIFYRYPRTRASYKRKNPWCLGHKSRCHRIEGPTHLAVGSPSPDPTRSFCPLPCLVLRREQRGLKGKTGFPLKPTLLFLASIKASEVTLLAAWL